MDFCKNRYLNALTKLVLLSATIHLIILLIYAIQNADIVIVNYFNILDFDLYFPAMIHGTMSQIISAVITVGIYLFFFFTSKNNQPSARKSYKK